MRHIEHWMLKLGFGVFVGFTAGSVVFCAFAAYEWWMGVPATPIDVALGVGLGAAFAGWRS